jgi:hypothetical protein
MSFPDPSYRPTWLDLLRAAGYLWLIVAMGAALPTFLVAFLVVPFLFFGLLLAMLSTLLGLLA